ncbi:MAG: hypothetical protein ACM3P0_14160 [Acidobacteriota bacterium]
MSEVDVVKPVHRMNFIDLSCRLDRPTIRRILVEPEVSSRLIVI